MKGRRQMRKPQVSQEISQIIGHVQSQAKHEEPNRDLSIAIPEIAKAKAETHSYLVYCNEGSTAYSIRSSSISILDNNGPGTQSLLNKYHFDSVLTGNAEIERLFQTVLYTEMVQFLAGVKVLIVFIDPSQIYPLAITKLSEFLVKANMQISESQRRNIQFSDSSSTQYAQLEQGSLKSISDYYSIIRTVGNGGETESALVRISSIELIKELEKCIKSKEKIASSDIESQLIRTIYSFIGGECRVSIVIFIDLQNLDSMNIVLSAFARKTSSKVMELPKKEEPFEVNEPEASQKPRMETFEERIVEVAKERIDEMRSSFATSLQKLGVEFSSKISDDEQAKEMDKDIEAMEKEISHIQNQIAKIKEEKDDVNGKINEVKEKITATKSSNNYLKNQIISVINRTSQLRAKHNDIIEGMWSELKDKEGKNSEILSKKRKEIEDKVRSSKLLSGVEKENHEPNLRD